MTRPLPTPEEDLDARQAQKTRTIAACREAARRLFSEVRWISLPQRYHEELDKLSILRISPVRVTM